MTFVKTLLASMAALATLAPTVAAADSCWWHNGSLMRLSAYGEGRAFHYENPREQLAAAGVQPGTMLFNGRNQGGYYSGAAQVFSSSCPGQPLMYEVAGPVGANQTSVTLYGTREVRNGCYGTGQYVQDVLTFTYAFQC
jgi:hypothetical protein